MNYDINDREYLWGNHGGGFSRKLPLDGIPVVIEWLKTNAAEILGAGKNFEIRRACPTNYGRGHGMAWVEGHDSLACGHELNKFNPERGYTLIGCFTTPAPV